jgi:hypothetical protein
VFRIINIKYFQYIIGGSLVATGLLCGPRAEAAKPPVSCVGAVMMGGAQLMCSHVDSEAPPQMCTYSWDLLLLDGTSKVVAGSFLIPSGTANMQIYQGSGYANAATGPIVMCRGKKSR